MTDEAKEKPSLVDRIAAKKAKVAGGTGLTAAGVIFVYAVFTVKFSLQGSKVNMLPAQSMDEVFCQGSCSDGNLTRDSDKAVFRMK